MQRWLAAAAAVALAGCGYIGDPQPPLLNIPARVTDLTAVQRGGRIILAFTVPALTTEGVLVKKPVKLDLRGGAAPDPFDANAWASRARQLGEGAVENHHARYEIPVEGWVGNEVLFAVRVEGANGRDAGWSNFATLEVVAPPQPPAALRAEGVPEGVRLSWQGEGARFRVWRRAETDEAFTALGEAEKADFVDAGIEYGKTYRYRVQSLAGAAESEPGAEVSFTPEDRFPPAVPAGVTAVVSTGSVELAWERNTEADFAAYRVYRAVDGGAFEKIGESGVTPSFSDRKIEAGRTYQYAVSSVDDKGNESARSEPVRVTAP